MAGNSPSQMSLVTFPEASQGVIYSDLSYSVILQWVTTMSPEPMLSWTLDGRLCGAGEKLFIHQLSLEQLGMYRCTAPNSEEQLVSEPVMVSLPQPTVAPTAAEPMEPDPTPSLEGGSAMGLVVAATVGGLTLVGAACFYLVQSLRYLCPHTCAPDPEVTLRQGHPTAGCQVSHTCLVQCRYLEETLVRVPSGDPDFFQPVALIPHIIVRPP
nr:immunoglobulin superfamily member 23 [Castor canadensis]